MRTYCLYYFSCIILWGNDPRVWKSKKRLCESSLKKQYVAINSSSVCCGVYYPGNLLQKAACTRQLSLNPKEKFTCFEDFTEKIGNKNLNDFGPYFYFIFRKYYFKIMCNKKRCSWAEHLSSTYRYWCAANCFPRTETVKHLNYMTQYCLKKPNVS